VVGAVAAPAAAQIYKCVDNAGRTTYQQSPCPPTAKGSRLDVTSENGATRAAPEDDARWEAAAKQKNVQNGMPRRYVQQALGTPLTMRPGTATDNAAEVWTYTKDGQEMVVGFVGGNVAWVRTDAPPMSEAARNANPRADAPRNAERRQFVYKGQDCASVLAELGTADAEAEGGTAGEPARRYVWEPMAGDPGVRTIMLCASGRVTAVERVAAD
jgi:hypothetical protein